MIIYIYIYIICSIVEYYNLLDDTTAIFTNQPMVDPQGRADEIEESVRPETT